MVAFPSDYVVQKTANETAETSVNNFYRALERTALRPQVASYFVDRLVVGEDAFPHIHYNGNNISDAAEFQKLIENFPQHVRFELEAIDANPINPAIMVEGRNETDARKGQCATISVMVSGLMHLGRKEDSVAKTFSDNFVLVPTKKTTGRRREDRKQWLIQIYNSRIVGQ